MPQELIPYRSLNYQQLRLAYDRLARERGRPPMKGTPSRVKLIERLAILKTFPIPPAPKPQPIEAGPIISKTPTQDLICKLLCDVVSHSESQTVGRSYPKIMFMVRRKFPKARTSIASIRKIASHIRKGVMVGTLPDIRQ